MTTLVVKMAVDCTVWHEVEQEMSRANREGSFHCSLSDTVDYSESVLHPPVLSGDVKSGIRLCLTQGLLSLYPVGATCAQ